MHNGMNIPILAPRPSCLVASNVPKPQTVLIHNDSDWAALYSVIKRLYVRERRKLRYVMQYMESEYGFKATEQMYKKRFAKWGFQKNSRNLAVSRRTSETKNGCKKVATRNVSAPREVASIQALPRLSHRDTQMLLFLTSVRTWSMAFFESVHCRKGFLVWQQQQQIPTGQLWTSNIKEISFALKLVVELLDRGHGILAGKTARKAFLLVEDILTLEGPVLVWNLLEIMHSMLTLRHAQLFHMLLAHLITLADGQMTENHPLPSMLRALRGLVESKTTGDPWLTSGILSYHLERAWTLNVEILFDHFDPRLFELYCRILWESCSISPPAAIILSQIKAHQKSSLATMTYQAEELLENALVERDSMIQRLLTPRMDASPPQHYDMLGARSVSILRKRANSLLSNEPSFHGDTTMLLRMLAGLVSAKILEGSPAVVESRLHARSVACTIRTLVDLNTEHGDKKLGARLDVVERIRAIVALRGYAEGETDPQVVREMWMLQDALVAAGELGEAQEVERDAYCRVVKYTHDIQ